jgi:hypothetical protein
MKLFEELQKREVEMQVLNQLHNSMFCIYRQQNFFAWQVLVKIPH